MEFGGVEHRIELVRTLDGVRYYNDSIATSPTRTIAGLKAFDQKLIVIAGGYDKKIPYEPLAPYINEKVKVLVLLGATAPKIEKAVTEDTPTSAEAHDPARADFGRGGRDRLEKRLRQGMSSPFPRQAPALIYT